MVKKYCPKKRRKQYLSRLKEKPLINIYESMIARCYNTNHSNYKYYGLRGINVCDYWLDSYENFENDMGIRSSEKLTLDRIDPNKGYYKDNCRWANASLQATNKNPYGEVKERYISMKRDKRYNTVRFRFVYKSYDRVFRTLEEAIEFKKGVVRG